MKPAKTPPLPGAADSPSGVSVEIEAGSREELFAEVALALCNCITEARAVMPRESRLVRLVASDADELLLAWVGELLAVFANEGLLLSVARVTITPAAEGVALEAQAWGEPFDVSRHATRRAVDKVDPLSIVYDEGRWRTRLLVIAPHSDDRRFNGGDLEEEEGEG